MKFKCIKDTIGFKAGRIYETDEDGLISDAEYLRQRFPYTYYHYNIVRKMLTEYFEEVEGEKWFLMGTGDIYQEHEVSVAGTPASYNIFNSKEAAEMEVLRRDSMANRWKPEDGESYCYFQFGYNKVYSSNFYYHIDFIDFFIGNTHKTFEDAEAWGKKYADAFRYLLK